MKRKELINLISALCLCTGVLSGCSGEDRNAVSNKNEQISAPETTAETTTEEIMTSESENISAEATTETETATEPETAVKPSVDEEITTESEFVSDGYNFKVEADGIHFFEGSIYQKIELDCSEFLESVEKYDEAPEEFLTIADFNFDGYNDLFVPYGIGAPNVPGKYFYMDPTKQLNPFKEWDELNQIGLLMSIDVDNQNLILSETGSAVDHEVTAYKWENRKLRSVSREVQYATYNNQIYIDHFEYDRTGKETFVKKERALLDENKEWLGTEEVEFPHSFSFSVNENSVEVLLDGKIVQTLECSHNLSEKNLFFEDYDFDGYNDLFIMNENSNGTYYRYVPDSGLFEKWDELNKIGKFMYTGISSNVSIGKILVQNDGNDQTFIYKWNDGSLILVERSETVIDENTNESVTRWYYIDEYGNEVVRDA